MDRHPFGSPAPIAPVAAERPRHTTRGSAAFGNSIRRPGQWVKPNAREWFFRLTGKPASAELRR
jgi:hypothetical protein